ncbi:MAG: 4-hydroxy-tetrahydrodipicolinate synthase [Natronomonas sp.]|jgi:4-hydroxy-tetrahydrodipicolinate synthase
MSAKSGGLGGFDLSGVIPPVVTAFDDDGDVDPAATAAHAAFVLDEGADAVFPLGTNGEFPLLTATERRRIVEAVTDAVDAPVIAGVGEASTKATVANAEHAANIGVDGVVVVTPYYYPVDETALVDHYEAVADAVDVPVYAYNIPSRTGNDIPLSALNRLAEIDGFAGFKDSSKDVPWLAQARDSHPDLTALVGSDSLLVAGLQLGCDGVVSAIANVFPELIADLVAAHEAGDVERAREIQSTVFDVRTALKRGPYMAGVKTALSLRDLDFEVGGLRAPLRTMDEDGRRRLEAELTDIGVL